MRTIDDLAAVSRLPVERTGQVVDRLANLGIVFAVTEPPLKSIRRRRITPVSVQTWLATPPAVAEPAPEPAQFVEAASAPVHVPVADPVIERPSVDVTPLEPPPLEAPRPSVTLPPVPAPPLEAFDADEESFFASPIDHLVGDDFFE